MLQVTNVAKSFHGKQVIKNINFQMNAGEIVAILGRSGGGKTTLLRCINALETPDKGTIKIGNTEICSEVNGKMAYATNQAKREMRKDLALVFQNYNLFPHMNVLENIVEAPINAFGIDPTQAKKRAIEILESMDLGEKATAYPFQLSGGQKQRVAIARACAIDPKIICFDEPTSALDPELTETVAKIMERLSRNENRAILLVTHDIGFVERVADRVVFMDSGEIILDCSKDAFFTSEISKVKSFIGTLDLE